MTIDNLNTKNDRSEFVRLMLDNDMQSSLSEVESAEKVKNYRHRSGKLADGDYFDADILLDAKSVKRQGFSPLTKIVAGVIIGVIVVSLLAMLSM